MSPWGIEVECLQLIKLFYNIPTCSAYVELHRSALKVFRIFKNLSLSHTASFSFVLNSMSQPVWLRSMASEHLNRPAITSLTTNKESFIPKWSNIDEVMLVLQNVHFLVSCFGKQVSSQSEHTCEWHVNIKHNVSSEKDVKQKRNAARIWNDDLVAIKTKEQRFTKMSLLKIMHQMIWNGKMLI